MSIATAHSFLQDSNDNVESHQQENVSACVHCDATLQPNTLQLETLESLQARCEHMTVQKLREQLVTRHQDVGPICDAFTR